MTLGSKKKKWQKHEKQISEIIDGKLTKGSGAGYTKGDIQSEDLFVECKQTNAKSFRVTEQLINKLEKDSFGSKKIPCICVQLGNKRTFYVLPDYVFEELVC